MCSKHEGLNTKNERMTQPWEDLGGKVREAALMISAWRTAKGFSWARRELLQLLHSRGSSHGLSVCSERVLLRSQEGNQCPCLLCRASGSNCFQRIMASPCFCLPSQMKMLLTSLRQPGTCRERDSKKKWRLWLFCMADEPPGRRGDDPTTQHKRK